MWLAYAQTTLGGKPVARVVLTEPEELVRKDLLSLAEAACWTVREEAQHMGLRYETLRGVLYRKNRPGPLVLRAILAFADRAHPRRLGSEAFAAVHRLEQLAQGLLGTRPTLDELLDSLYRRVTSDFDDVQKLAGFLGVTGDEWNAFAKGREPSSDFLEETAAAYSEEAARREPVDDADVLWCRRIAEIARQAAEMVTG